MEEFVEFDSLINIRPKQDNRSRYVESESIDRAIEKYQHSDLAAERWQTMTLSEQLANIGSEFGRAAKRKEKGDKEKEMKGWFSRL